MVLIKPGDPVPFKTVVALGFFDSLHLGHRKIIQTTIEKAAELGAIPAVFTFSNNPAECFGGTDKLVYTFEERCEILEDLGIGTVIFTEFDYDFKNLEPERFMLLLKSFNPACLVCGFDYTFGKDAKGTPVLLDEFFKSEGVDVLVVDQIRGGDGKIGSTGIRNLLRLGEIEKAGVLLGEAYRIEGTVCRGYGVGGSKLGFPTVNLQLPPEKLAVKAGVYAGKARIAELQFPALINVGSRPTFLDYEFKVEAHILKFDGNLYGKKVVLFLERFLREIRKFDSPEELKTCIERDKAEVLRSEK